MQHDAPPPRTAAEPQPFCCSRRRLHHTRHSTTTHPLGSNGVGRQAGWPQQRASALGASPSFFFPQGFGKRDVSETERALRETYMKMDLLMKVRANPHKGLALPPFDITRDWPCLPSNITRDWPCLLLISQGVGPASL